MLVCNFAVAHNNIFIFNLKTSQNPAKKKNLFRKKNERTHKKFGSPITFFSETAYFMNDKIKSLVRFNITHRLLSR